LELDDYPWIRVNSRTTLPRSAYRPDCTVVYPTGTVTCFSVPYRTPLAVTAGALRTGAPLSLRDFDRAPFRRPAAAVDVNDHRGSVMGYISVETRLTLSRRDRRRLWLN
jgi:hypothetical protein